MKKIYNFLSINVRNLKFLKTPRRFKMKRLFLLIAFIAIIPSAYALEISLQKGSFFPGETFLAEINGGFTNALSVKNVYFINKDLGKEVSLAFYLLEISKQRYYVWVSLPEITGNYKFSIQNVMYRESGTLKGDERGIDFEIKASLSSVYKSLQSINWQSASVQDNAFALIALSYDSALANAGKNALMSKTKDGACWPASGCNAADTALALFALAKTGASTKTGWLLDAQNNLDIGLWDLAINSDSEKQCDYLINNDRKTVNLSTGSNIFNLDLKSKPEEVQIFVNCSVASAKIVHTYSGTINEFQLQKQSNSASIALNNQKCFGKGYRTDCDATSTAYAALALDALKLEKSKAVEWLAQNAQKTREKAIALYLKDSSELKEWLTNNQNTNGYWAASSLSESQQSNLVATAYATMALEERKGSASGREWLKKQLPNANTSEKALALSLVFSYGEIEPLISFNPAAVKTNAGSSIEIEARNKGIADVNISASLLASKQDASMKQDKSARLSFAAPSLKDLSNTTISIEYSMKFSGKAYFNIPVFITAEQNITTPSPQPVPEHFRFSQNAINARLLAGEKNLVLIQLKNLGQSDTGKIDITYTRDLREIMNITPLSFDKIEAGGERTIKLSIEGKRAGNYSGSIIAVSGGMTANFSVNLTFTTNASQVNTSELPVSIEKSCTQQNGTICSGKDVCNATAIKTIDAESCCTGSCVKRKEISTKMIGILMLLAAFAVLAIIFLPKLKKPKKEMKDVLTEIENKYDKYTTKKTNFPA